MADGGDDCGSSWTSWFKPGDSRRLDAQRQQQKLTDAENRSVETARMDEQRAPSPPRNESNDPFLMPFIAIKHFLDDQITAIAELPKNWSDIQQRWRDEQLQDEEYRQGLYKRWTGGDGDFASRDRHFLSMDIESLSAVKYAAFLLVSESEIRNRGVPAGRIAALYDDPEAHDNRQEHHYGTSITKGSSEFPNYGYGHSFLSIPWFKYNAYSPITLEANPLLSKYDTKWRHAFEDLLNASLDKPMSSEDKRGARSFGHEYSTWHGPGLDWMLSLQCRGILPPQFPFWYRQASKESHIPVSSWVSRRSIRPAYPILLHDRSLDGDFTALLREIATPAGERPQQELSELDMYEQFKGSLPPDKPIGTELERYSMEPTVQREEDRASEAMENAAPDPLEPLPCPSSGRCPDKLGRAVGDAAQQRNSQWSEQVSDDDWVGKFNFEKFCGDPMDETEALESLKDQVELLSHAYEADTTYLREDLTCLQKSVNELWQHNLELRRQLQGRMTDDGAQGNSCPPPGSSQQYQVSEASDVSSMAAQADTTEADRPSVLSTLTKTQTTRMPDGSVKTTVVLKRRFADGHEETQESTQTTFDDSANEGQDQKSDDKKGWFWS